MFATAIRFVDSVHPHDKITAVLPGWFWSINAISRREIQNRSIVMSLHLATTCGGKKCAEAFGVSPQQWSPWERGMKTPDELRLVQIADFFGVTVEHMSRDHSAPDFSACSTPPNSEHGVSSNGGTPNDTPNRHCGIESRPPEFSFAYCPFCR